MVTNGMLDDLARRVNELAAWNDDLAAAVFELGGFVADQSEEFDGE